MNKRIVIGLLLCAVVPLAGCGTKQKQAEENTKLIPSVSTQRETTTQASGEQQQGARIEFVTREHKMERVIFSGGYLYRLPEISPETLLRDVPAGSQGMIYGKREINGRQWAKVTTRDGLTGWYTMPDKGKKAADEDGKPLDPGLEETDKVYRSTYPRITGGVAPEVQENINKALDNYLEVYRFVTGPVGSDLGCRVTYNRQGILSLVFSGPPIRFRAYSVSDINNTDYWKNVKKYVFISPLWGGSDPKIMTAAMTDIRYGMVFDLHTGRRMTLQDFIGSGQNETVRQMLSSLGEEAQMDEENFYVDENGQLFLLASREEPEPGRVPLELSSLVVREY
jgi:hypothetical protein